MDEHGITLKDIHIPQARGLVECEVAGEETGKDGLEVGVWGAALAGGEKLEEVLVQRGGFGSEGV